MNSANSATNSVYQFIHKLTRYALYAGMGWVLVMMLLTTLDVAGRYFFSKPLSGGIELAEIMLAVFGLLGMAYTHQSGANIRVTMLTKALPPRVAAGLDVVTHLLCLVVVVLLAYQGWMMGLEEFSTGTTTDSLKIPIFPIYFLLSLGSILIALEMVIMLMTALGSLLGRDSQANLV